MSLPRRVRFSEYALLRMKARDILKEEVRAVLDRPMSSHKRRRDGRTEVRARIGRRNFLVIYVRRISEIEVINAMNET